MAVVNKIKFSELNKTSNLIASSRVQYYWERMEIKPNNKPLNYFLCNDNDFSVGQLKTEEYREKSETNYIPIVDQSKTFIAGYTDREDLVYKGNLPVIVFGDHTRIFKFVDFPFVQGADGIKILFPDKNKVDPLFFYYVLRFIDVPSRGYNRHFSLLSVQRYLLFDFNKQKGLVSKISPYEKEILELENSKLQPVDIINQVFGDYFKINLVEVYKLEKAKILPVSFSSIGLCNSALRSGLRWNKMQYIQSILYSDVDCIKMLGRFIKSIKNGWSPLSIEGGEGVPVLGQENYSFDGVLRIEPSKFTEETRNNIEDFFIQKGDFFISRGNTVDLVALASIVNDEIEENIMFPDLYIRVELDETYIDKQYLSYIFNSFIGRLYFKYVAKGKNQTMVKVSSTEILNFRLPIPELEEQTEIVEAIKTQLDSQKEIERQVEEKQQKINKIIESAILEGYDL